MLAFSYHTENEGLCPYKYTFMPAHACMWAWGFVCVCVFVVVCAWLKAATVVVASWGIEINECNQKQTASQARAINTSKASGAAGLLGQAWLEPKRWRIKMQPQTNSTAFPHTADVRGGEALGAWHRHTSANRPLAQPGPILADNLLAAFW